MPDAPRFPAAHFDAALGLDLSPAEGQAAALRAFAAVPDLSPLWCREEAPDRPVRLVRHGTGLALPALDLRLTLAPDPSNWLRLDLDGAVTATAWVERPYEDWDLYPGLAPARLPDAPGRMGQGMDRLELDSRAWPALAPWANAAGWLILAAEGR